jgi:hypothetical protein
MVTRNVDRFLAESIESILNQSLQDLEFVIVDFGSSDRTAAIISNYAANDHRLRFHVIPTCGLDEARNVSCSLARGRYIAIMDADDIAVPDRLLCQLQFLEMHPGVGVLGGATEWIDREGKSLLTRPYPTQDADIRATLRTGSPFCNPTVVMRKEIFHAAGGFRKAFAPAEDYDLWLRIARHCQMANLPEVLLKYRIHPYQESNRNIEQMVLGGLAARISTASVENGRPDPLESVDEVTPALVRRLGVSEAEYQLAVAIDYWAGLRRLLSLGEYAAAQEAAYKMLGSSDWKQVENRLIADVWVLLAGLHWRGRAFSRSIIALARGVSIRPAVAGRPLKRLAKRIQMFVIQGWRFQGAETR